MKEKILICLIVILSLLDLFSIYYFRNNVEAGAITTIIFSGLLLLIMAYYGANHREFI